MYWLLILNLIIPFVMLIVGYILKKNTVENMKSSNGYNTPTSRKSKEHWEYAQSIAPNIFINQGKILAIIEIVLSVVLFVFKVSTKDILTVGIIIGFIFLLFSFYKTENKINNRFTNNKSKL